MSPPPVCPFPSCPNHHAPPPLWAVRFGHYFSRAHGPIQRYRCRLCLHTFSDQSSSLHYFAKRRLPLQALWHSLLAGSSLRDIARRYHLSPPTVQNALLRLGRQAMAAHLQLLASLPSPSSVLYDGLRSCVSSHDYPCDLTTVVEPRGEMILSITHSITRRAGTMTPTQRRRVARKELVWHPVHEAVKSALTLLHTEIWDYLRPVGEHPAVIHTDENPLYRSVFVADAVAAHFRRAGLVVHRRTAGSAPRTVSNPLFAVNYVDRLLRHRLKEHTRESIAIAREATMQMHRAWIFAFDHNCFREYRVKRPRLGSHGEQAGLSAEVVAEMRRKFFHRRIVVTGATIPETIRRVWMGKLATPPLRWRKGQQGSSVHVPGYAIRDLFAGYQHAA